MAILTRRSFFLGLLAAPAIVRVASLERVRGLVMSVEPAADVPLASLWEIGWVDDPARSELLLKDEPAMLKPGWVRYFNGKISQARPGARSLRAYWRRTAFVSPAGRSQGVGKERA
jgi:hypothetical protein